MGWMTCCITFKYHISLMKKNRHLWMHFISWNFNQSRDSAYGYGMLINPISTFLQCAETDRQIRGQELVRIQCNMVKSWSDLERSLMSCPTKFKLNLINGLSANAHKPQCWISINMILWHSLQGNIYQDSQDINPYVVFEICTFKITATSSPSGQWVNKVPHKEWDTPFKIWWKHLCVSTYITMHFTWCELRYHKCIISTNWAWFFSHIYMCYFCHTWWLIDVFCLLTSKFGNNMQLSISRVERNIC